MSLLLELIQANAGAIPVGPGGRPIVGDWAEELYARLSPLAIGDEEHGWPFLLFCGAIGDLPETIRRIVRVHDDGPGYSRILSASAAPEEWLDWLGQFLGVRRVPGLDAQAMRRRITQVAGWDRGQPAAIAAAVRETLAGEKRVILRERDGGDRWQLRIATFDAETPDPAATLAAALAAKPAGIKLTYDAMSGWDIGSAEGAYATVGEFEAAFPSIGDAEANFPA